jgi:hypothetical protein
MVVQLAVHLAQQQAVHTAAVVVPVLVGKFVPKQLSAVEQTITIFGI